MINHIDGDILEFEQNYFIAHQCNCKSTVPYGLAKSIFDKYPYSNIYNDNSVRIPGNIIVRKNVINMLGQVYPGRSSKYETKEQRKHLFNFCLKAIQNYFKDKQDIKLVFPKNIGCNLAGGNWKDYEQLLIDFEQSNPNISVTILKFTT
jgi:hypothetical protein